MHNVIPLHPKKCPSCWKTDINEYCEGYKNSEPFSYTKVHFGYLLCQVIENESIPINLRREAGYVIYNYSDYRAALDHIFNPDRLTPQSAKE